MMMLGPEGAQLPGVTPAGAETATGGPRPVPRPPAPHRSRYVTRSPRGGHISRGERKRWRENIYGDVQIVRRGGGTLIKDAVTSRDMPALSYLAPCLGAEIAVQGGREKITVNINT